MTYVFQPARYELFNKIKLYSHHVKGQVLDVGAGSFGRYQELFKCDNYVKLDRACVSGVDVVGSAEDIPLPDCSFDSLVCTQVLGDVFDLPKAFSEFYRVLRNGGTMLVTESLFDPLHDEPHDYWRFTPYSLQRLAEEAGFNVEVIESFGGYRSVIVQLKIRYWIEKLVLYKRWYVRIISKFFVIIGRYAIIRDKMKRCGRQDNRKVVHGYVLVASKP